MSGDSCCARVEKRMMMCTILLICYTVKTEFREVFEKCFNLKRKCFVATEISHAVFHNSDTKCLDHPTSYLQLFGK